MGDRDHPSDVTDISTVTDVTLLKSMFFDQQVVRDQAQSNMNVILQRIQELSLQIPSSNHANPIEVPH